tara:strand:- start:398 stop:706 length:309 start_codon:yes stop_codon:yes gene_type:complete
MKDKVDPLGEIVGRICSFIPKAGEPRLLGKVVKKGETHYKEGYSVPNCTLVVEGRSSRRIELSSYIGSWVYLFDSWSEGDKFNENGWSSTTVHLKPKGEENE